MSSVLLAIFACLVYLVLLFNLPQTYLFSPPIGAMKICVTGANGQTGSIVVRKIVEHKEHEVVAVVRSEAAKKQLLGQVPQLQDESISICESFEKDKLKEAFATCDKLVILTSSKPKLVFSSLFGVMFQKYIMRKEGVRPTFYYPEGQTPRDVDWIGQKAQIDAAKELSLKQVVLISSMAGTQPDHFLNTMGGGKIVLYKRKAEKYLIDSGIPYTIIHPGGLLPHYGKPATSEDCQGFKRELVVAVDDALLESKTRLIPREDVAEVTVQALQTREAINTSWDLVSKNIGEGEIFTTLSKLLKGAKSLHCNYEKPDLPE